MGRDASLAALKRNGPRDLKKTFGNTVGKSLRPLAAAIADKKNLVASTRLQVRKR